MGKAWARISSPARTPGGMVSPPPTPREGLTSVSKEPAPPVHPQCKCSQGHAQLSAGTGIQGDAVLSLRRKP